MYNRYSADSLEIQSSPLRIHADFRLRHFRIIRNFRTYRTYLVTFIMYWSSRKPIMIKNVVFSIVIYFSSLCRISLCMPLHFSAFILKPSRHCGCYGLFQSFGTQTKTFPITTDKPFSPPTSEICFNSYCLNYYYF